MASFGRRRHQPLPSFWLFFFTAGCAQIPTSTGSFPNFQPLLGEGDPDLLPWGDSRRAALGAVPSLLLPTGTFPKELTLPHASSRFKTQKMEKFTLPSSSQSDAFNCPMMGLPLFVWGKKTSHTQLSSGTLQPMGSVLQST